MNKKTAFKSSVALLAMLGLGGCGLPGTFRAESFIDNETLPDGPFTAELAKAYQQRAADAAVNDVNWILAGAYAQKGRAAAAGNAPEPWDPANYGEQPTYTYGVDGQRAADYALADRRVRLVNALAENKDRHPTECAQAQAHYDWLVDEVYQDTPPTPADEQKKIGVKFEQYLAGCVGRSVVSTRTVTSHAAPKADSKYVVYFAWDRYNLTPEAKTVILSAAKTAGRAPVSVSGYTDTSGKTTYNDKLSDKRAHAVSGEAQHDGAVIGKVIGRGERDLAKSTADGVREPLNRRAVIDIAQ